MKKYVTFVDDIARNTEIPGFYFGIPGRKDAFIITERKRKSDSLCLLIAKTFHFTDIASPAECIAYVKPFIEKASLRARDFTIRDDDTRTVKTSYSIRGKQFCSVGMRDDVTILAEMGE